MTAEPMYTTYPAWYGRRVIQVQGEALVPRLLADLQKLARQPCMIWFEGDTWKLENPTRLIEIGKTKAFRFSHIVDCEGFEAGPLPPWCEELDELSLHIKTPRRFEQIDAYNQAVQTMWFGEGLLSITVDLCGLEDLDMAYYLHSLTPNDLDFYLVCHQQGRAVENALYANPLTFRFLNLGQE